MIELLEYNRKDFYNKYADLVSKIGKSSFVRFFDWLENEYKENGGKPKFIIFNKLLSVFENEYENYYETLLTFQRILSDNNVIPSLVKYETLLERSGLIREYNEFISLNIYHGEEKIEIKSSDDLVNKFNEINNLNELVDFCELVEEIYKILMMWDESRKPPLVEENDKAKVYKVGSYYHSLSLGKGTKWCTTRQEDYNRYSKSLDMYVIVPKTERGVYGNNVVYEVKYLLSLLKDELTYIIEDYLYDFEKIKKRNDFLFYAESDILLFSMFGFYDSIDESVQNLMKMEHLLDHNNLDNTIKRFLSYLENNKEALNSPIGHGPMDASQYISHLFNDFYKHDREFVKILGALNSLKYEFGSGTPLMHSLKSYKEELSKAESFSKVRDFIFDNSEYIRIYNKEIDSIYNRLSFYPKQLDEMGFFEIIECADNTNSSIDVVSMFDFIEDEKLRTRLESLIDLSEKYYSKNIDTIDELKETITIMVEQELEKRYLKIKGDPRFKKFMEYIGYIEDVLDEIDVLFADVNTAILDDGSVYFDEFVDFLKRNRNMIKVKLLPSSDPAKNGIFLAINS
ncbi:MAG: hypothetical protein N3A54_00755 [Patescibacteria group bacterium]|nr:hypothetical protein [Patescibacteria group bacterium]